MIIIRDLWDVETLERKIKNGDVLEIYNTQYDVSKIYWNYKGLLMASFTYYEEENTDYCSSGEFHNDIRTALKDATRYFIKLVTDTAVEVVIAEEDAVI